MMQQYKVKPISLESIRTYTKRLIILIYVLAFLFSAATIGDSEFILIMLIIFIVLILGTFYMINIMTDKWQKPVWDSYILTITDDSLTREQLNTPKVTILKSEISEIIKGKYGNIVVMGNNKWHFINIPPEIEYHLALENELSTIQPLTINPKRFIKQHIIAGLVSVTLMLCFLTLIFWENSKILIGFAGFISASIVIWLTIRQHKSMELDTNSKKIAYMSTLMQLSYIFYFTYSKLKGL